MSQTELAQRRQKLRQRRRVKFLQASWRVVAVCGLTAGVVWAATLPTWVIRRPEQVRIEGNHFIPVRTLRSLLPIPYPQSLFRVEPQLIARELQARAPIEAVIVSRQLFPPGLIVQVKERLPVAIAVTSDDRPAPGGTAKPATAAKSGLLDEKGMIIPLESYVSLDQSLKLPTLKVIGNPESYRSSWPKLYRELMQGPPINVSELDWRDPANLILKTELGLVYTGPYNAQFPSQLKVIDRMRRLSKHPSVSQITYIDLRNPEAPTVQMPKPQNLVKSGNP
ncbi:cell division protein FtsQ/DivIB [Stenomitos frigidus]|uniref:cell division protein FtsQ/DivIB n=1 Tax=Stenomitos frigidus TaxID=1886765 RepID=UPI001FE6C09A|nr:FtsQ-type POTRA domain-containing protein [Stenomitos frigidus]